jgi:hypothetical protein
VLPAKALLLDRRWSPALACLSTGFSFSDFRFSMLLLTFLTHPTFEVHAAGVQQLKKSIPRSKKVTSETEDANAGYAANERRTSSTERAKAQR